MSYDTDGRLIKDHQGVEYAYDDSGYLLSVNTPNERIDYDYWPNGQLAHRKVSTAQSTQSSQIYHDHNNNIIAMNDNDHWRYLLKDKQRILASSDVSTASSFNEETSTDKNNMNEWFMSNHSVGALLSEAGHLSTKDYMAYGASLKTNAMDKTGLMGWHQQYLDTTVDLVYFNSRFYSPMLKRFITPDNLLVDNRYRYAKSNPLFYHDPTGHNARALNYSLGPVITTLGIAGIIFAIPTGGASLTLSGGAAFAASVAAALSGVSLIGSQGSLDHGNKKVANVLQATSLGLGLAAFVSSAASFAPAISGWLATGEFSVASHWYNLTGIWDDLVSHVPNASVAEGGTSVTLSGLAAGEQQDRSLLTETEWRQLFSSSSRRTGNLYLIDEVGQPPRLQVKLPRALRITLSTLAGSTINTALASVDVHESFGATDMNEKQSESTDADTNQRTQGGEGMMPQAEVLNWSELRSHSNQHAPDKIFANDVFFSPATEPFGIH